MEQENRVPMVSIGLEEMDVTERTMIRVTDLLSKSREEMIALIYGYSHVYESKKEEETTIAIKDGKFLHILKHSGVPLYENRFVKVERFKAGEMTTLAMMENPEVPGTVYTTHINRKGEPIHDLKLIRATKFKPNSSEISVRGKIKGKRKDKKKDRLIPSITDQTFWTSHVTDVNGHEYTIGLGDYGVAISPETKDFITRAELKDVANIAYQEIVDAIDAVKEEVKPFPQPAIQFAEETLEEIDPNPPTTFTGNQSE